MDVKRHNKLSIVQLSVQSDLQSQIRCPIDRTQSKHMHTLVSMCVADTKGGWALRPKQHSLLSNRYTQGGLLCLSWSIPATH